MDSVFTGGQNWRTDFTFAAHNILIDRGYGDQGRTQPLIPSPDITSYPGAMPWMSPLGVRYVVAP